MFACFMDGLEAWGTRADSQEEALRRAILLGYREDLEEGRAYLMEVDPWS